MSRLVPVALLALAACSSGDADNAAQNAAEGQSVYRGVMQDRSASSPAEALYVEKCGMCHRQMGMGTVILARRVDPAQAPLEARTDLTVDYIRSAARQGVGNMPRISRAEVSDEQLDRIAAYLVANETQ